MSTPIVVVASGGLPVTEAANGQGMPVSVASNGFGIPVTIVASGGTPVVGSGGAVTASFAFAGSATDDGAGTTRTYSIDIGTAAANRLIVVAIGVQNAAPTSITVAGTTLTPDVGATNANFAGVYSALVTTGSGAQNVVVSGVGAFNEVGLSLWIATGLSSNVVKNTGFVQALPNAPLNISVTAGDFLVAVATATATNSSFASSTQVPTTVRNVDTVGPFDTTADWISILATNAAFSVAPTTGNSSAAAGATYR